MIQEHLKRTYGNIASLPRFPHNRNRHEDLLQPIAIPFSKEQSATPRSSFDASLPSPVDSRQPGVLMNDASILFSQIAENATTLFDDYSHYGIAFSGIPIVEGFFSDALFPSLHTLNQLGGHSEHPLVSNPSDPLLQPTLPNTPIFRSDDLDLSLLSLGLCDDGGQSPVKKSPRRVEEKVNIDRLSHYRRMVEKGLSCEPVVFMKNGRVVSPRSGGEQAVDACVERSPQNSKPQTAVPEDKENEVSFYKQNCLVTRVGIEQPSVDRAAIQPFVVEERKPSCRFSLEERDLTRLCSRYCCVQSTDHVNAIESIPQTSQGFSVSDSAVAAPREGHSETNGDDLSKPIRNDDVWE